MVDNQEPQEDEINMEPPEVPVSRMHILEKSRKTEEDKKKEKSV